MKIDESNNNLINNKNIQEVDNVELLKISTINYGDDGIYLTSEEISDLL